MKRVAVLISGRGSNMKALVEAEREDRLPEARIVLVVSNVPTAPGLEIARSFDVETAVFDHKTFANKKEYEEAILKRLREREIDIVALAGYMRIVGKTLLDAFPLRMLNIHPALLPSFPGLHGQKQAIDYGVKISGCSVHFVDPGVDTGPIILQKAVPVHPTDDEDTLSARILKEEHKLYPRALDLVTRDKVRVEGRKVFIEED